jgi:hypothetical protein
VRARRTHLWSALALAGVLVLPGCGGESQDENEVSGDFPIEVVSAGFPSDQKLAKSSDLTITLRNAGDETVPNLGVTVTGFDYRKTDDPSLADPDRPVFAVNGVPVEIGGFPEAETATPRGCATAYDDTWACGPLRPGQERTMRWSVTAVRAGPYKIDWSVNAGLHGNAKAVLAEGGNQVPGGTFTGTISDEAPEVRISDDGRTVVSGDR